jgi:hypothetical protein
VKLRYFGILLVPVVIFLIHSLITDHMIPDPLEIPADILRSDAPWMEAAGRYRFLSATWFFGALAVLSTALLVRTLLRPTTWPTRLAAMGTLLFVVALAASSNFKDGDPATQGQVYDRLGGAVFDAALSRGTLPGCNRPEDRWLLGTCGEAPVISLFAEVMEIVNVLAGLAIGSMIAGMILCLDQRETGSVEEEAALLAENMRQMRLQLYLSGLILTFGMLFATSWMYWPMSLVASDHRADFGAVVLSAALYTGTYFSLLILSFYLPVALILDGRIRALTDSANPGALKGKEWDAAAWKKTHGLTEGAADYLRAGLALTAPILAAFAGGISPVSL